MEAVYGFSNRRDGDMHENENLARFLESLGVGGMPFVRAEQVRGGEVARVGLEHAGQVVSGVDGLITARRGLFLAVLAADCIPALIYDRRRDFVAAAHLGWRGLSMALGRRVVEQLEQLGSVASDIVAIFGPSICVRHYEVKEDLVSQFVGQPEAVFLKEGEKTFMDLRATARNQFIGAGVPESNIDVDPTCTFEDSYYFSWRREQPGLSGSFAGVIGITS